MEHRDLQVHLSHCCIMHGCKYNDADCPVANKLAQQQYLCEECMSDGIPDVDTLVYISLNGKPSSQPKHVTEQSTLQHVVCRSCTLIDKCDKTTYLTCAVDRIVKLEQLIKSVRKSSFIAES